MTNYKLKIGFSNSSKHAFEKIPSQEIRLSTPSNLSNSQSFFLHKSATFKTKLIESTRISSTSLRAYLAFFKLSLRFKETRLHQVAVRGNRVKVRVNDLSYCNAYISRTLRQVHCFTRKIPSPVYTNYVFASQKVP